MLMKKEWLVGVISDHGYPTMYRIKGGRETARRKERVRQRREDDELSLLRMDGWLARGERAERAGSTRRGREGRQSKDLLLSPPSLSLRPAFLSPLSFSGFTSGDRWTCHRAENFSLRTFHRASRLIRINQCIASLSFCCPFKSNSLSLEVCSFTVNAITCKIQ